MHALRHYRRDLVVQLEGCWDMPPGVGYNMGFTARAAAKLIEGFQGSTFRLKHLPIGGLLNKYLGF